MENTLENILTFYHSWSITFNLLCFSRYDYSSSFFSEVCGQASRSSCELIKSLCEGGGCLFTGLRGRGVRKVLEILAIFGSEDNIPIRRFFASLICFYPSVKLEAMKIGVHNL